MPKEDLILKKLDKLEANLGKKIERNTQATKELCVDVRSVKTNVEHLKGDVGYLKRDVQSIRSTLDSMDKRLNNMDTRLTGFDKRWDEISNMVRVDMYRVDSLCNAGFLKPQDLKAFAEANGLTYTVV